MQLNVFEHHHARDPETSKEAAETMIKSGKMARQCQQVYDSFKCFSPCTSKELSVASGLDYHMIARRMPDLVKAGKVAETGVKRDKSMVWEVVG